MTDLPSAPINAIVRPVETMTQSAQLARVLWLRTLFGDSMPERDDSAQSVEPLAHRMTEFFMPRGALLYREGTSSDSLFFVVEGAVRQGEHGYTLFIPGDVLGFIDAMMDRTHRFTATIEEDAVILRLRIDDWLEYLEDHFEALRGMIESTLKRWGSRPEQRPPNSALSETLRQLDLTSASRSGLFVRRLLAVKSSPLFERASIQALSQLVRGGTPRFLSKGQQCEKTDEPGIWIVVQGFVRLETLTDEESRVSVTYGPGSLVDSPCTLLQIPEVFSVTAEEDSELLYMSTRDLYDIMEDHFDVARSTLGFLARRQDELNERRKGTTPRRQLPNQGRNSLNPGA